MGQWEVPLAEVLAEDVKLTGEETFLVSTVPPLKFEGREVLRTDDCNGDGKEVPFVHCFAFTKSILLSVFIRLGGTLTNPLVLALQENNASLAIKRDGFFPIRLGK